MFTSHRPSVVTRRLLGTVAGALLLAVILGCMSISFEGRKHIIKRDDLTHEQSGKVVIPAGGELEVYYPMPYASPPNLVHSSDFSDCQILEQRPDYFRVKNPSGFSRAVTWTAQGLKGPPPSFLPVQTPPAGPGDVVPTGHKQ